MRTIAKFCRYTVLSAFGGGSMPGSRTPWLGGQARSGADRVRCCRLRCGTPPRAAGREYALPYGSAGRGCRRAEPSADSPVPAAGDWLSGRAPRSHRGGHWFDPSIAHRCKARSEAPLAAPILLRGWELLPYWEIFGRPCSPARHPTPPRPWMPHLTALPDPEPAEYFTTIPYVLPARRRAPAPTSARQHRTGKSHSGITTRARMPVKSTGPHPCARLPHLPHVPQVRPFRQLPHPGRWAFIPKHGRTPLTSQDRTIHTASGGDTARK